MEEYRRPGRRGFARQKLGSHRVHDAVNDRMSVFGGTPSPDPEGIGFNDVWVLTYANGLGGTPAWTVLKPSGTPPGTRSEHAAVYDAVNNRMLAFAGTLIDPQYYMVWILTDANGI
jgi:hypothetical protein